MGRLLGYKDLSALTGMRLVALRQRRYRGVMPEPTIVIGYSPYWDEDGPIREWLAKVSP